MLKLGIVDNDDDNMKVNVVVVDDDIDIVVEDEDEDIDNDDVLGKMVTMKVVLMALMVMISPYS